MLTNLEGTIGSFLRCDLGVKKFHICRCIFFLCSSFCSLFFSFPALGFDLEPAHGRWRSTSTHVPSTTGDSIEEDEFAMACGACYLAGLRRAGAARCYRRLCSHAPTEAEHKLAVSSRCDKPPVGREQRNTTHNEREQRNTTHNKTRHKSKTAGRTMIRAVKALLALVVACFASVAHSQEAETSTVCMAAGTKRDCFPSACRLTNSPNEFH